MVMMSNLEISQQKQYKNDMAWQYCQKLKEGNREHIKCLFCGKVSKGGGIHRFKEHLAGRKGGGPMCQHVPPDVKTLIEQYLDASIGKPAKRKVAEPLSAPSLPSADGFTVADPFESPQPVSSTRRKKDLAWQHCRMLKDGSRVQIKCNYCSKVFKGGGIHRFKEHLAGRKGAAPVCHQVPADVRIFMQKYLGESEGKVKMKRNLNQDEQEDPLYRADENDEEDSPSSDADPFANYYDSVEPIVDIPVGQYEGTSNGSLQIKKSKKVKAITPIAINADALNMLGSTAMNNQIRLAMARFLYDIGANLDLLDSSYFQPFIDMITPRGSGTAVPSPRDFRGVILKSLVEEVKNDIDQQRASIWEKNGCSLLVEESNHGSGRILLSFFVNSANRTVFLKSVDASSIIYSVDSLYGLLKQMVEEVGAGNVLQVITNADEHYYAVGKRLMSTFPSLYWAPCAAHCIDLILEDLAKLDWINGVIEQAKSVTRFIYNHSAVLNLTRKFTFGNDIVQQAQSRSATNFSTLKRMADFKLNLQTMVTSQEWSDCPYSKQLGGLAVLDIVSNRSFWSSCILIIRLTTPLLRLLGIVASKERASMGYVFGGMYQVKETIKRELLKREDYLPYWDIIDHKWEALHECPLHATGFFLNPKLFYSIKGETHNEIVSRVFDSIERLLPDIEIQDKAARELNSYKDATGDLGRKMAIRARETMLPAEWWSTYGGGCPNLARFAIRILSQTSSSISCKQHHIPLDKVYDTKNCLERQRLSDLVFVQYNLRLRQRVEVNKPQVSAEPVSFDNMSNIEDWLMQNELCLENYESADWMALIPPSDNAVQSEPLGEETEELVTGFDDIEIFEGMKKATKGRDQQVSQEEILI